MLEVMTLAYRSTELEDVLQIDNLITYYYYELSKDYTYHGEKHDFWELVYVDQGSAYITRNNTEQLINQGTMVLHKPMEFHAIRGTGTTQAHVLILTFKSSSICLYELAGVNINFKNKHRIILKKIYKISQELFIDCCGKDGVIGLELKENPIWGGKQLIKGYIEELMITLIQQNRESHSSQSRTSLLSEEHFIQEIKDYIAKNLNNSLTNDELSNRYGISRNKLYHIFKNNEGCSVKEFIIRSRIEEGKRLLREKKHTVTEISYLLGYHSVHHFSKQFKERTGAVPTHYAKSIKFQRNTKDYKGEKI